MNRVVAGIDPGKTGAIAQRRPGFDIGVVALRDKDWDYIRSLVSGSLVGCVCTVLERVNSRPDDDPYSAFQFGRNTGKIEAYAECFGPPLTYVPPQTWQREFGLGGKFSSQAERKRAHKKKAQELFPYLKVTLDTCDAILICEYAYRLTFGGLTYGKDPNFVRRDGTGLTRITRVSG